MAPSGPADHLALHSPQASAGPLLCSACNERPVRYKNRGLCHPCYVRPPSERGKPRKKIRRMLSPTCSYDTAHTRCKNLWGSASLYPCIQCSEPAREWAYDGTDPTEMMGFSGAPGTKRQERRGGTEMAYSAWPEFYMPMCSTCHSAFDHPGDVGTNPDW
ncbi:hypothetical protein Wildcat_87 [Mycobacterium phage Wildcat]|uniref:Uncharacterized protein n=2 Tax=Mycobacterium virus Wildcat TaxID=1993859 RepID=Q19XX3_9CAUD|nr:hypothetical protein Wildcat_87 [Mycobacterium phage Wildcat]ABE67692.1 hypothetical protein Wildcat_87 [Mycobacterium phage Wildcat]QGJ89974.1 hypothetical protein PBI_MARYV_87 [Mycobacterium phage MaryV]